MVCLILMCYNYHGVHRAHCNLSVKVSEKEHPNQVKLSDGHAVITTEVKLGCSVVSNIPQIATMPRFFSESV